MNYQATVHHEKLNVDFFVQIDANTFSRWDDDAVVECFDNGNHCRKFLKSYLNLTGSSEVKVPKKHRKKKGTPAKPAGTPAEGEKK